ncbi:MAG: Flp family type IVb pilin [Aestuariivirga sp.]
MQAIVTPILRLLRNENGATAIEYGLIAAGIAVALIPVMSTLGVNLTAVYGQIPGWLAP